MNEIINNENLLNDPQSEDAYLSIRGYVIDAQRQVYSAVNVAMVYCGYIQTEGSNETGRCRFCLSVNPGNHLCMPDQANDTSIIEAYTAITGNGYAFPFGIYDDDIPVGFLMIGFDVDDYWEDAPEIAKGNYNLWRLMIDKELLINNF